MKTVFNNSMVAHVWAQQTQQSGRSGNGQFYFEGPTIYSYRDGYPVGHIMDDAKGRRVALIWNGSYSVTTSRHQHEACGAVRHLPRFNVPNLPGPYSLPDEICHARNLTAYVDALKSSTDDALKAAGKSNMRSRRYMFEERYYLENKAIEARDYCAAFNLEAPDYLAQWDRATLLAEYDRLEVEGSAKTKAKRAKLIARHGSEAAADAYAAAERAVDNAKRWLANPPRWLSYKASNRMASIQADFEAAAIGGKLPQSFEPTREAWCAYTADLRAEQERQQREAQEQRERYEATRRMDAEQRAAILAMPQADRLALYRSMGCEASFLPLEDQAILWREGEIRGLPYNAPTAMRLSAGGTIVKTSKGAEFPAEHARKAWTLIRRLYQTGGTYQRNGHTIHVGHFVIDSIDAEGTLRAGCHILSREEVERLAAALGLEPVRETHAA